MSRHSTTTRLARIITWVVMGISVTTTVIVRLLKRPATEAVPAPTAAQTEGGTSPPAAAATDEASRQPQSPGRRRLLSRLSLALGGYIAAVVGVPSVGLVLAPLIRDQPEVWRSVGEVGRFPEGEMVLVDILNAWPVPWAGQTAISAVWLRHEGGDAFTAFSVHCTHLGCPVRWQPGAQMFICPCHGGAFYSNGAVASGPPPMPMEQFPTRVRDGQVEVRTGHLPIP